MADSRIQARKRALILRGAQKVFSLKGYSSTTMQDIADYCEISRSSVYCYFPSTFAILHAIIDDYSDRELRRFHRQVQQGKGARQIMEEYFDLHKTAFSQQGNNLVFATIEWYWEWGARDGAVGRELFTSHLSFIRRMVDYGVERGEFTCADAAVAAAQINYLLFGIRAIYPSLQPTAEEVDRQLDLCRVLLYPLEKGDPSI